MTTVEILVRVWAAVAAILAVSALPVVGEAVIELLDPRTSTWNRQSAAIYIPFVALVCLAWPVALVCLAAMGLAALGRKLRH